MDAHRRPADDPLESYRPPLVAFAGRPDPLPQQYPPEANLDTGTLVRHTSKSGKHTHMRMHVRRWNLTQDQSQVVTARAN